MPASRLKSFLDSRGVKYTSILHSVAFTMQEIASLTHIPGREIAKTVMVFADDRLVMAIVPASKQVSLARLKDLLGASTVTLATEAEFRDAFPDCEPGAMPPFGVLYDLKVCLDEALRGREMIFNAGSHRELIRISWADYQQLVQPVIGNIAVTTESAVA
jgi:Ala-tRNA(Pro) deacylase